MSKTLREKLQKKKQELKSKGNGGKFIFLKAGDVVRGRIIPSDGDKEFILEVEHFYLGSEIGGIISPHTFGLPCAIYEKYQELKKSKDPDDKDLAAKITFRSKYAIPLLQATSQKGGDYETEPKFLLTSSAIYSTIIDLYLDEDEWGDMTDYKEGYDLKFSREGSGKNDTTYDVQPCKPSELPKKFRLKDGFNIEDAIKRMLPTYEETEAYINQFLGTISSDNDEEEEDDMKSRKKDKKKSSKLKKHRKSDGD